MNDDPRPEFSHDELIKLLEDASRKIYTEDGALTTKDIMKLTGWSDKKIWKWLGNLKVAGKIEIVKVQRETLDDKITIRSAYKIFDNAGSDQ